MRRTCLLILFLGTAVCFIAAQESTLDDESGGELPAEQPINESDSESAADLDDLFNDPPADVEAPAEMVDHRSAFEESATVAVNGHFEVTSGFSLGWSAWDMFADPMASLVFTPGLASAAAVSFDARPDRTLRVYGRVGASFNPLVGAASWSSLTIEELYGDYIVGDSLFIRLGKHSLAWGQGRVFAPGNLMADSSTSYNLRLSLPGIIGSPSLVVLTDQVTDWRQMVYATKLDFVLADTYLSPAVRYTEIEGFSGLLSLKRAILQTDISLDLVGRTNAGLWSFTGLGGFFREWDEVILYGEYQVDWLTSGILSHKATLALGLNNPGGVTFDCGLQVVHYFDDNSGIITLGLTQVILPHLTLNLGIPVIYGAEGSAAVVANAVSDNPLQAGKRVALMIGLILSTDF